MPDSIEALYLQLSVVCPACMSPVPINGLTEALPCPRCSDTVTYPAAEWVSFFDVETLADERLGGSDDGTGSASPVMFACMSWAGPLKVDGASRSIACTYYRGPRATQ